MKADDLAPWLFAKSAGGIRWGLERTRELLAGVGDPHRHFHALHVAGTNGKGSVAALCAAALRRDAPADRRVGLYTSPHLVSFAERVRIDGRPAPDALIVNAAERLRPAIERTGASFFEATTAIAFLCFAEAGVEVAVVEVGLGGRLDATNVLDPVACAITNISREHTEYLGESLEAIAREKGGILKRGVPAVSGESAPEVLRVLGQCAAAAGAPLVSLDEVAQVEVLETGMEGTRLRLCSRAWGERQLRVPLAGVHQARNAALAAELLALLPPRLRPEWEAVARGFDALRWPARFQIERLRGTTWVFDVAHNPAGCQALAATLARLALPRPRVLLIGILSDKDWREMLPPLLPHADALVLSTPPSAPPARRWNTAEVAEWLGSQGVPTPRAIDDFAAALERAATLAPHGTVIVAGSFHTTGDAMRLLGVEVG